MDHIILLKNTEDKAFIAIYDTPSGVYVKIGEFWDVERGRAIVNAVNSAYKN